MQLEECIRRHYLITTKIILSHELINRFKGSYHGKLFFLNVEFDVDNLHSAHQKVYQFSTHLLKKHMQKYHNQVHVNIWSHMLTYWSILNDSVSFDTEAIDKNKPWKAGKLSWKAKLQVCQNKHLNGQHEKNKMLFVKNCITFLS